MATKKKEFKIDMFKQVLPALDTRKKNFYENLNEEEQQGFEKSTWLAQRYLSSAESATNGIIEHYLIMTNEIVNTNFSDIKDPEMLSKLMSIVGIGKSLGYSGHPFIPPPKGRALGSPFKEWLRELKPHLSDFEIDIWMQGMDKEYALEMLGQFNVRDKDIIASANDL